MLFMFVEIKLTGDLILSQLIVHKFTLYYSLMPLVSKGRAFGYLATTPLETAPDRTNVTATPGAGAAPGAGARERPWSPATGAGNRTVLELGREQVSRSMGTEASKHGLARVSGASSSSEQPAGWTRLRIQAPPSAESGAGLVISLFLSHWVGHSLFLHLPLSLSWQSHSADGAQLPSPRRQDSATLTLRAGWANLIFFPSSHFPRNIIFSFAKPLSKNYTLLYNLKSKTLLCQRALSVWLHSSVPQQAIQKLTYASPAEPGRDLTATSAAADTEVTALLKSLTPS